MSQSVCLLAASAVERNDPNYKSVWPQIKTAFDNCLMELKQVPDKFYDEMLDARCQAIIKVLESCRSPFEEKLDEKLKEKRRPSEAEQISLLKGISADHTLNKYLTVGQGNRIELATLGDAKAVHSAVEGFNAISQRSLNCDSVMQEVYNLTIGLAQTDFFKKYVAKSDITSLNGLYNS